MRAGGQYVLVRVPGAIYSLHKARDAEQTGYIRTGEATNRPTSCSSPYTRVLTLLETRTCKVPDSYAELCTRCNKQGNLAKMEATLNRPTVDSDLTDSGVQHSHFGRDVDEVDTKPTPPQDMVCSK